MILLAALIFGLCCFLSGMMAGIILYKRNSVNYKERAAWAINLLNDTPEARKLALQQREEESKAKAQAIEEADSDEIKAILKLPPSYRDRLEADRISNELEPIDPLTNLPPSYYVNMKRRRYRAGWED